MGNTYAILALRRKRAHLAGEVAASEAALAKLRHTLATIDATIRVFEPHTNPELIAPIRPRSPRALFFRKGELARLCLNALREAGKPIRCRQVLEYAMQAKGLDLEPAVATLIMNKAHQTLLRLERKGVVQRIISHPDAWWDLVTPCESTHF